MNDLNIKEMRDKLALSQTDFAKKIGVSLRTVQNYEAGGVIPESKYEILRSVSEGEMLKRDATSTQVVTLTNQSDKVTALKAMIADMQQSSKRGDKIRLIPLMNIDAVGGSGNDICDTQECIEEFIPVKGARDKSICIPVSGDSMVPIFSPGDLVVIDEVEEWTVFLEMGQYYVIILKDGRRLIKKVTYSEVDRNLNFLLVSENLKYPPVELPKAIVKLVFIVTQKHQKLTL